jgi:hypothetical protein
MGSCHFPDRETEVRRRKGLVHHAEAERRRLSRKRRCGSAVRSHGRRRPSNKVQVKGPDVSWSNFPPSQSITHCNCNHFAPIRSRSVTATSDLRLCLSQLAGLLSGPGGHGCLFRQIRVRGSRENSHCFDASDGPSQSVAYDWTRLSNHRSRESAWCRRSRSRRLFR